ncbi:MAG: InlB B-repeat-containing protein [Gemmatimonadota bacterium]
MLAAILLGSVVAAGSAAASGPAPLAAAKARMHFILFVTISGEGSVTSDRPTADSEVIDCPDQSCSASIATDAVVKLTATPNDGWEFVGWSGDCIGTGSCSLTMDQTKVVTASFRPIGGGEPRPLSVAVVGDGDVTSSPAGITCPDDCAEDYDFGTVVSLTASPGPRSTFSGWSGGCSGRGSCEVTLDRPQTVGALFAGPTQDLSVAVVGEGTARSSPPGIECPIDCDEGYPSGTTVTLTASPATEWLFGGWEGACAGTGTCMVSMDEDISVTARFAQQTFPLAVSVVGQGTVSSVPAGIDCPDDCEANFVDGATATLTANPSSGWELEAWDGNCTGDGACVLTIEGPLSVGATFRPETVTITVAVTGSGSVASTPSGIACPAECAASFPGGTTIQLAASPGPEWAFAGWRGACTGSAACSLAPTTDIEVTAAFRTSSANVDVTSPGSAGRVDGYDLALLLEAISSNDPGFDLNADGATDLNDLNIVLQALGGPR